MLGTCLLSLARGGHDVDAEAGAFVVAETVLLMRATLIGLSKTKKKR